MIDCVGYLKPSTLRFINKLIIDMEGMLGSADRMLSNLNEIEDIIINQEKSISPKDLSISLGVTVKIIISWRIKDTFHILRQELGFITSFL
jgi:hypothetical protein